jgi:hypothetical protein
MFKENKKSYKLIHIFLYMLFIVLVLTLSFLELNSSIASILKLLVFVNLFAIIRFGIYRKSLLKN